MTILNRVLEIERDFIKAGFKGFTVEEMFERAAAIGASDERLRLANIVGADAVYGIGGD